jgi:hypothetical protein
MGRPDPARYPWQGEYLTVREVAARVTAYSKKTIERALRAGCQDMADLARMEAANYARSRERGLAGARAAPKFQFARRRK